MGRGNFWAGLASGLGTGVALGEQFKKLGVNADLANVAGQDSTQISSGEDAYAAGKQAYEEALARAQTPEERDAVEKAYRPTLNTLESNRNTPARMAFTLGTGDNFEQSDAPFSKDQIQTNKTQQRADIYRKAGMNDEADKLEDRAQSRRLTGLQIESAQRQSDRERSLQAAEDDTTKYMQSLIKKDDQGNALPMSDDDLSNAGKYHVIALANRGQFQAARQAANDVMDRNLKVVQAQNVERKAAVDQAVPLLEKGTPEGYAAAINVYNKYVPDGSKATDVIPNADGSITVKRVSSVDGSALPDGKFKSKDDLRAAVMSLSDPNAVIAHLDRTFDHDIKSRQVAASEKSASASMTSAAATARESGVKVKALETEMLAYGALGKPAEQRTDDEKKAVQYITGKVTASSQTPEHRRAALDDLQKNVTGFVTAGKGAMDSLSPDLQKRAQAIIVRSVEMGRQALEQGAPVNADAIFKRAAAEYDAMNKNPATGGVTGAAPAPAAQGNYSALWR